MKNRKSLCVLLAVLMFTGTLGGCAANDETDSDGTSLSTTTSDEAVTQDPSEIALSQLTDVDWGGKDFTILYVNDIAGYSEEVEAEANATDQTSAAVINDAVYERNITLEERCRLNIVLSPTGNSHIQSMVQNEVSSGTGEIQFIIAPTSNTASMSTSAMLYNYLDLDIDYEAPWWDPGTLDFALNGNVFFMNGAHNIVDDDVTFVMMFNKELQSKYKVNDPYTTVRNGDWTLSYFNEIIQNISTNSGDPKWDENDTYGFSTPGSIGNTFFYGADLQYIVNSRDMDTPELVLNQSKMEKLNNVLELAQSIVHKNNSTYIAKSGDEALSRDIFVEDRSLFYCEAASYLRALNQSMEGDYGVVPIPKYDKEQENYLTWTHSIGSTLSMPTTVHKNAEQLQGVLETYVILSYQLVKPAYYNVMLTSRNVRDPDSAEMLDIIFQNRVYDMAMYFNDLGLAGIFEECVKTNSGDFTSSYNSASQSFEPKLRTILSKLNKP